MNREGERPRPVATDEASQSGGGNHKLTHDGTSTEVQVRRRRRASFRCPQMADGRQDTLEMQGVQDRTPDVVAEIGRRTVWWSADWKNMRLIYMALDTVGSKRMKDPLLGLVCSPITTSGDVIACLEYRHRLNIQIVEVNR